jgi:DNA-binding MarR family transcriptional regulator
MATRPTIADYRALADFRHQLRRFLRFSEDAARIAGLEPRQHQLLLAVKGMPDGVVPTIGAIAERLQLQQHSVVELVDRMAEHRLVQRLPGVGDRRQVLIAVTARGETLLARLSAAHRAEMRSIGPRLRRALDVLVADMESTHPAAGGAAAVAR